MKHKIILCFAVLLLLPAAAPGQQELTLTIEQAIDTGLENSKALHTSQDYRIAPTTSNDSSIAGAGTLEICTLRFGWWQSIWMERCCRPLRRR